MIVNGDPCAQFLIKLSDEVVQLYVEDYFKKSDKKAFGIYDIFNYGIDDMQSKLNYLKQTYIEGVTFDIDQFPDINSDDDDSDDDDSSSRGNGTNGGGGGGSGGGGGGGTVGASHATKTNLKRRRLN